MIVTKFTIEVEYTAHSRHDVDVVVYGTSAELRAAASAYSPSEDYSDTLGLCHRFTAVDAHGATLPACAIVRLSKDHLGVGLISHELAHAAVWMWELDHPEEPLETRNDEEFCWILGSLVKDTVNALTSAGCYA